MFCMRLCISLYVSNALFCRDLTEKLKVELVALPIFEEPELVKSALSAVD